jgi:hypothetical protein
VDRERVNAAVVALGATAALALVLVAMAVLDEPWLGAVAIVLLFVALGASRIAAEGARWFLGGIALTVLLVATLYVVRVLG